MRESLSNTLQQVCLKMLLRPAGHFQVASTGPALFTWMPWEAGQAGKWRGHKGSGRWPPQRPLCEAPRRPARAAHTCDGTSPAHPPAVCPTDAIGLSPGRALTSRLCTSSFTLAAVSVDCLPDEASFINVDRKFLHFFTFSMVSWIQVKKIQKKKR